MSDLREASEMALEFVDWLCGDDHSVKPKNKALEVRKALRQALSQPEQEPVAWFSDRYGKYVYCEDMTDYPTHEENGWKPLYTAPPKREWVGLTDEEMEDLWDRYAHMEMMRAIEAKLKEKNT